MHRSDGDAEPRRFRGLDNNAETDGPDSVGLHLVEIVRGTGRVDGTK